MTCDYGFGFKFPASYGRDPHTQHIKVRVQSVQKLESKQHRTDTTDCSTLPLNAVDNYSSQQPNH